MCLPPRRSCSPPTHRSALTPMNSKSCQYILSLKKSNYSSPSFIRFQSLSLMGPNNSIYPALAFSAKFTYVPAFFPLTQHRLILFAPDRMSGMSGTFNATVQQQIDGQSTAPIGGTAAAASSTPGASASTAPTAPSTTSSSVSVQGAAAKTSSGGATSTPNANSARGLAGASGAAFAGAAVAVLGVAFFC